MGKRKSKIDPSGYRSDVILYSRIHGSEKAATKFNIPLETVKRWIEEQQRMYEDVPTIDLDMFGF